ncbi:MAG: hypothetical protein JXB46_05835, partial [Candidatus Eisenbacteria bacterium]|nr:hypothetical protein [Candidatus Eisenbacteria bacterium]
AGHRDDEGSAAHLLPELAIEPSSGCAGHPGNAGSFKADAGQPWNARFLQAVNWQPRNAL